MNNKNSTPNEENSNFKNRLVSILAAILIHVLLLFFAVFTIKTIVEAAAERPDIIKLTDIREEAPKPRPIPVVSSVTESVAETVVESDEVIPGETASGAGEVIDFLPMHLVSQLPRFSEEEIRRRVIYPPIAQRSELEGTVYLEIFVDREGRVRSITILKEDPPDRGFGEAAARAFQGLSGSPALANGMEVAVRYRYPVRFSLK
jgi:protein TonB